MKTIKNIEQMNEVIDRQALAFDSLKSMLDDLMFNKHAGRNFTEAQLVERAADLVTLTYWFKGMEEFSVDKDNIFDDKDLFKHVENVEKHFIKTIKQINYNKLNSQGDFSSAVTCVHD